MKSHPSLRCFAAAGLAAACLCSGIRAQAQLLEYEGFEYTETAVAGLSGGTGWGANAWADADNDVALSGDATSLLFTPVTSFTPLGARVTFAMSGEAERRLGTPMSLASATNWYFSALVKRQGDFRIEFMDNSNNVRWRMGGANGLSGAESNAVAGVAGDTVVPGIFPTDETVFIVCKISAFPSGNDVAYMNVYRTGQVIPATEPVSWQVSGGSASGVSLTRLQIRNISDVPLEIDEIRIGTTFAAVAGPKLTGPPIILAQPLAQTNYQGTQAQFTVDVVGELPFSYVWKKDGQAIVGATDAVLVLTNLSPADAGNYSVEITNPAGSRSSSAAALTVIPVTDRTVAMTAYWNFDETTGLVAKDSTTNRNDGLLVNFGGDDTQWVPTFDTRGIAFNGQNYVEVQDSPAVGERLRNRFSLALWFKSNVALSANGATYRLLEKENSFFLLQGDGGGLGAGAMNLLVKKNSGNVAVGIGQALLANRWYHMAVTYDGSTFRVYLDGQLRGSRDVPAPIDGSNLPLHIGADYTADMTGARYFNGVVDEVALWERPLMQSEILVLAGKAGVPQILEQPTSVTNYAGGTAIFRVGVTRGQEPLRYLWYHGTEEIRAASGPVLTLYGIEAADAGEYRCRVSNDLGEVQTAVVTLTVTPVTGVNDALQVSYNFNETTGLTAADASAFARTGDLVDYPDPTSHWVPGKNGNALKFDGFMNRLVSTTATNMELVTDATVSFWIKPASYGTLETLANYSRNLGRVVRKGGMLDIQTIDDPGSVRATIVANGVPAQQNSLALDQWQHFVVVYQGNIVSFYKNGIRLGDPAPGSLGGLDTSSPLVLGNISDQATGTSYFQGDMDDVKIWTRILNESEILTLAGQDASGAPVIVNQPQSATRYADGSVSFSVGATGLRPITYEWRHNGVPIPNSNTNRLSLSHLTLDQAGDYTVVLQNGVGSAVTSAVAQLVVKEVTGIGSGLVAYWPFNETAGAVVNDASGRGHHGTLNGFEATTGNAGVVGGSLFFDGLDDFIVVPHANDLSLADQATISVWVSPTHLGTSAAGGLARIIRKDINYDVSLYSPNSSVRLYGVNKAIYDAPVGSFTTNQWQHLAIVMKDGFVQFYKNGVILGAPVPGALGPATTTNLIIGNFGADLSIVRLFMGNMDELGLWERALSPAEIDGIYQNGTIGRPLNAVFEPLQVRSMVASATQAKATFYSPYSGRQHAIQTRASLAEGDWIEQTGVTFTPLGNGLFEATFPLPEGPTAFYRIGLQPKPAIFSQDFEASVAGWTHDGPGDNWEWGTPVNGPKAAYSGTKVYATSLTGNLQPYTDSWLRTPPISLVGQTRATLTFQEWRNVDPNPTFHYTAVNLIDAASGTVMQQLSLAAGGTTGYESRVVTLPAQAMGKSIIIEFVVHCDDFNLLEGWYIDDVKILPE